MNGILNSDSIIGIKLKSDGFVFEPDIHNDGVLIGSIICDDSKVKCNVFRELLTNEISDLPENYKFLSKCGSPIDKNGESKVEISQLLVSNIITIQRHFDLPRLGVKWQEGECLGFIFISFNSSLTVARQTIAIELNDKFLHPDLKFEFLDKNGWPVTPSQEKDLAVWDICVGNMCNISKSSVKRRSTSLDLKLKRKNLKLTDKKGFQVNTTDQKNVSMSILISYVHAEASIHAKDLKSELINMGIDSVFLDVDDIPAGRDWQDVINSALNNCSAFVALVTPRYGETRWTNREAKLADDKEKLIIPISFLQKWPPDQLAIQFLSLQYIPWIIRDDFVSDADFFAEKNITHWDQRCVHRVAKEIKQLCSEQDISTPDSLSLLDSRSLISNGYTPSTSSALQHSDLKKHLIVISAHSEQKHFVDKLVHILEEDYRLWLSINEVAENGESYSSNEDSQLSENSPCVETFSHAQSIHRYNNSDTDYSCKLESKGPCYTWKDNGNTLDSGNFQCKKTQFKRMVKCASLVILINSEEYIKSRACKQQAFYCEQRVEVIVIKYGIFQMDNILSNLYPEQDMLEMSNDQITKFHKEGHNNFITNLKKEIAKSLENRKNKNTYKDSIQEKVADLKKEIGTECCVYVIGGTNSVSNNAETFCINLGSELAKLRNLTLVTEGFFGAGEKVGKNFCEEKEILAKGKPKRIFHVVPFRDHNNTKRARQREDGSFEKIPYGRTLFYGNSITERDDIVSSTFKICILIEGGERSASLAEKFLWNDCTVVPIIFNNRAISSKECLAASIKKPPLGVNVQDWCKLNNQNSEELAKTVMKIISDLLKTRFKCFELKQ